MWSLLDEEVRRQAMERAEALVSAHITAGFREIHFEAHSADCQRAEALTARVEDHCAVLKVGPGLTARATPTHHKEYL
jgi:tagatose-1,6-bisphosphate aldolase non-catalytic subunit AgaZ/GatZ